MGRRFTVLGVAIVSAITFARGAPTAGAISAGKPHIPAFGPSDGTRLMGLSCPSPTTCTAVGNYYDPTVFGLVPISERWNGHNWTVEYPPDPKGAGEAFLQQVSCASTTACTAVGYYEGVAGTMSLAESWNGHHWVIQTTPDPSGASDSQFEAVACPSAVACTAVGYYDDGGGTARTLVEGWNGHHWTILRSQDSGAGDNSLYGVSCPSAKVCTAVGQSTSSTDAGLTLAEGWNGHTWAIERTAQPSGSTQSNLQAVGCRSARACTAVGEYASNAIPELTLAEGWNGHNWAVQDTADPSGAQDSYLNAVACPTATACTAVGSATVVTLGEVTLAERWNGHSWTLDDTPGPSGSTQSSLQAVRCPSMTTCIAVGSYLNATKVFAPLAERWNGKKWTIQPTPDPSG